MRVGGSPSPNLGVVTVIDSLGFDADVVAGLDIVTPGNRFYALLRQPDEQVQLARLDVDTSTNSLVTVPLGLIDAPGTANVEDIAVQSFPVTAYASFGVIAPDDTWGLAEGRVGGPDAYETYILLANPGTTAANVIITFYRSSAAPFEKTFVVPAASRLNIATGPTGPIAELVDEEFSAVVESSTPIVVERAMYSSAGGLTWSAGTNATATRYRPPR